MENMSNEILLKRSNNFFYQCKRG